ncbi:hypothetical protein JYT74_03065 [Crocinitomix catalasitica]|nr:hypothetical protein [Crocinitomix catalasitica]
MSVSESFEQSFQYYLENEKQLLAEYKNQVIAIHLDKVLGVYKSKMDAYLKVPTEYNIESGSFVIKNCSEKEERYVRVYHSNSDLG